MPWNRETRLRKGDFDPVENLDMFIIHKQWISLVKKKKVLSLSFPTELSLSEFFLCVFKLVYMCVFKNFSFIEV